MAHKLPTELIEHIFTCLDENDKAACAAVCRTNKLGQKIATPLLYQHISFDDDVMDPLERSYRLQCLCEAFVLNPKLINYVESIHLQLDRKFPEQKQTKFDFRTRWSTLIRNDMDVALWLRIMISAELDQGSTTVSDEMCSILVLLACNRLQSLRLSGDLSVLKHMELFTQAIEALGHTWPVVEAHGTSASSLGRTGLHSVENVALTHTSDSLFVTKDVLPLLNLPSMVSLGLNTLTYSMNGTVDHQTLPSSSSLETLAISDCDASWHDLEYLIKCCRNLKSLQLDRVDYNDTTLRYDWEDVRQALRTFVPNIENIRLEGPDLKRLEDSSKPDASKYRVLDYLLEHRPLKSLACTGLALFTPGYHWTLQDTASSNTTVPKEEQKADFVLQAVPATA